MHLKKITIWLNNFTCDIRFQCDYVWSRCGPSNFGLQTFWEIYMKIMKPRIYKFIIDFTCQIQFKLGDVWSRCGLGYFFRQTFCEIQMKIMKYQIYNWFYLSNSISVGRRLKQVRPRHCGLQTFCEISNKWK